MKRISIFKRLLILVLVFILSINSFAAIVADNDGATFITKAEFDSLKNSFQAQINNYNMSIDSKIEGAIVSYLSGIKVSKEEELTSLLNKLTNYTFEKNWGGFPTAKGDKAKLRMAAQVCLNNDNSNWMSSNGQYTSKTEYLWELVWGSVNRDSPNYKEFGTNKDKILVYKEDESYAGKITPVYIIESVPECSVLYAKSHTALTADIDTTLVNTALSEWTEDKGDTANNFGTYSITHYFDPFGASKKQNVAGTITYMCQDTNYAVPTTLPTTPVTRTETLVCMLQGDENKIGGVIATKSLLDCGTNRQWTGGTKTTIISDTAGKIKITPNAKNWDTNGFSDKWKAKIYRHKINQTYTLGQINLSDISAVAGEYVTYGDGLPLCNVSNKGRLTLTLNTGNIDLDNGGKFEIRKGKFNNSAMNITPFATLTSPEPVITTLSATAPYKYKVQFNVEKGLYYIICQPQDDASSSSISTEEIKFTIDE